MRQPRWNSCISQSVTRFGTPEDTTATIWDWKSNGAGNAIREPSRAIVNTKTVTPYTDLPRQTIPYPVLTAGCCNSLAIGKKEPHDEHYHDHRRNQDRFQR